LKLIAEAATKFVPLTVNVKVESPAVFDVGEIEVVVGAGLFTVNVCVFEIPPPGVGFVTVMLKVLAVVRSLEGIEAVS